MSDLFSLVSILAFQNGTINSWHSSQIVATATVTHVSHFSKSFSESRRQRFHAQAYTVYKKRCNVSLC